MSLLTISSGPDAYAKIQRDGLCADDINAVFGASGAAKWMAIYGLDKAIFSQWFSGRQQELLLFGTSVGAFKLAAACHTNPVDGLDRLAQGYIHQSYPDGSTTDDTEREFLKLKRQVISPDKINEILLHPSFRFSCGAVRCLGDLASHDVAVQKKACIKAAFKNLRGRHGLQKELERIIFYDVRAQFPFFSGDNYRTEAIKLNQKNLEKALSASGSIPVYMKGIENIPGAGEGLYRDGGLLDYHPVPENLWRDDGLILYPHFYSTCSIGWFDKFLPWRKATAQQMRQVVMVSPTQKFLGTFELCRIPDRRDFKRFAKNDSERIRLWQDVADKSQLLGEEFMALANSGRLAEMVKPMA